MTPPPKELFGDKDKIPAPDTELENLEYFLEDPEIERITELIRRNHALATIIAPQHTTQYFATTEELEEAFELNLPAMDEITIRENTANAVAMASAMHDLRNSLKESTPLDEFPNQVLRELIEANPNIISPEHIKYLAEEYEKDKGKFDHVLEDLGITEEDIRAVFKKVWVYSRLTNPTNELFEEVVSEIEHTEASASFSSGLAAINATVRQFVKARTPEEEGGTLVIIGSIYGGTTAAMKELCKREGINLVHMPIREFERKGLPPNANMVYFETSNNPTLRIVPIEKIVEEAKRVGAISVCDNTFTPISVKPADHDVDLIIHSMTKYMGGKSEDLGGIVSGNQEMIIKLMGANKPNGLHEGQRMIGGANMAPRVAIEFLKNIMDLPERLYKSTQKARAIARMAIEKGLNARTADSYNNYDSVRDKHMPIGLGNGMVSVYFETAKDARLFVNELAKRNIGKCAVSLGSTTTYISIPSTTTHSELSAEEQKRMGITPGLVRISCGQEENLVQEIEQVISELTQKETYETASA